MCCYRVNLNSVEKVKNFVAAVSRLPMDLDLASGRYVVDAKSIMGIFSLDLTQPMELQAHEPLTPEMEEALAPYLMK
jgi:phosphotransferase system HPr-like phosphotransfer protein